MSYLMRLMMLSLKRGLVATDSSIENRVAINRKNLAEKINRNEIELGQALTREFMKLNNLLKVLG